MKTAIIYTALSLLNLIVFLIGVAFLPDTVAIHFNAKGIVDGVGSPWVLVSVPAAATIVSAGLCIAFLSHNERNRKLMCAFVYAVSAILIVLGWVFFALSSQTQGLGDKINFPFALITVLPISLLLLFFGNYMPRIKQNAWFGIRTPATLKNEQVWTKTHRVGGYAFVAAGFVSAVSSILFTCISGNLAYISVIVLLAALVTVCLYTGIYAHVIFRKIVKDNGEEAEQSENMTEN